MKCPRCHKETDPGGAFCMHCGLPLGSPRKSRAWLGWLLGGALAVGILLFGTMSVLSSQRGPEPPPILEARGTPPSTGLLEQRGAPAQAVTPAVQAQMPQAIRDWLQHLERIEARKNELSRKQTSQMLVLAAQMKGLSALLGLLEDDHAPTPAEQAGAKVEDLKPEWNALIEDFIAFPPPEECKLLGQEYYRALSEIPIAMNEVLGIMGAASSGDPADAVDSLRRMQNSSFETIDARLQTANEELGKICGKYQVSKWFSIRSDSGGSLLGIPGF